MTSILTPTAEYDVATPTGSGETGRCRDSDRLDAQAQGCAAPSLRAATGVGGRTNEVDVAVLLEEARRPGDRERTG